MSLRPEADTPVPDDTARIARAAFPHASPWMRLRDALGPIFADRQFATLFPTRGRPAETPWRLALVTVMQFAEQLSDRAAANAVRGRIDWKYALGLPLDDAGFDASVLCEFRARLIAGSAELILLETVLTLCRERHWLHARGRQRTDSTAVLSAIRRRNRIETVRESVHHALNVLADVAPAWLLAHVDVSWRERYRRGWESERLPGQQADRDALVAQIGADGLALLRAVFAPEAPTHLAHLPALTVLRQVWLQNYVPTDAGVRWRTSEDGLPPARAYICSPYDTDAHVAVKRGDAWMGYKVHLTETCDPATPNLVTDVVTTTAPIADGSSLPTIQQRLAARNLLPHQQVVDAGYVDAELLVTSQRDFAIDLLGPTHQDNHWQIRAQTGFEMARFRVDWERQQAICPAGKSSVSWTPTVDNRRTDVIKIRFSPKDCAPCPHVSQCARSASGSPRRLLTVRQQAPYEALAAARGRETTAAYRAAYACRSGVEGTISQGVRTCGLRRSRYCGLAKTQLSHVATATALNCLRLSDWLAGRPKATTQRSRFTQLLAAAT